MAKKIELASLSFDVSRLLQNAEQAKKAITELRLKQDELKKQGEQSSAEYIQNTVQLKNLSVEYTALEKVIRQHAVAGGELLTTTQVLDIALKSQNVTLKNAVDNNNELIEIRKSVNLTTDEGRGQIEAINEKIKENNIFIADNTQKIEKQNTTIAAYKDMIKQAFNDINIFNGGLSGFIDRANEAGGAGPLISQSFAAMRTGISGITKAGLAFIATPIGAAIAAIAAVVALCVGAFKFMTASMNSTEEGSQKIAKVTAAVTGVFDAFWKLIKPLGEWLGTVFIEYVEMVGSALDAMTEGIATALDFLGFEGAAAGIREVKDEVVQASKAAADYAQAEANIQKMQREGTKQQAEFQKQIEKLQEMRDDESKSISERINLTDALAAKQKQQMGIDIEIAREKLRSAELLLKKETESTEAINAHAKAEQNLNELKVKFSGIEKEQIHSLNALRKEAADKEVENQRRIMAARQQAFDNAITKMNLELDLYRQSFEGKKLSMDEEIAVADEIQKQKLAIAQKELDAANQQAKTELANSKKTADDIAAYHRQMEINKLIFTKNSNQATMDSATAKKDAVLQHSEEEYKAIIAANQLKLDSSKYFNQQQLNDELKRIDTIAEAEKKRLAEKLLAEGKTQEEINALLDQIDIEAETRRNALKVKQQEHEAAEKVSSLDRERIAQGEAWNYDLAAQLAFFDAKTEQERIAAKAAGADMKAFEEKKAEEKKQLEQSVTDNKVQLGIDAFTNLATILGKESAAGKAVAVYQATMDTYQAATAAYKSLAGIPGVGPALGAAAAAAAVTKGMANIKKITSAKPPKAEKGALFEIGGRRHSAGGTLFTGEDGTSFEAEKGELIGVMNRSAARHFMAFNNSFLNGGAVSSPSSYLATGGIVSRAAGNAPAMDYDLLAAKIAQANTQLPSPVVAVTDIAAVNDKIIRVQQYASH